MTDLGYCTVLQFLRDGYAMSKSLSALLASDADFAADKLVVYGLGSICVW